MDQSRGSPGPAPDSGFALLVVLLVLIALLVLAAPFLLMARNADRASAEITDRAEARLSLDAAARHARLLLGASHSGLDPTPYFDSLDEIAVDNRFDPAFLDANDEKGLMWDLESRDVSGTVDLNSAPSQMIANLMGASTRFPRPIKADEKEVALASSAGLEPAGVVWVGGELLRYTQIAENALIEPVRGLLGPSDASEWKGGPLPPSGHGAGAPVIDQRAFAPALWRLATSDGEIRAFDSKERLREAGGFVMAAALAPPEEKGAGKGSGSQGRSAAHPGLTEEALRPLFLYGSVHAGVRGGPVWQRPVRLTGAVKGGEDGILHVESTRWLNPGSTVQISDGAGTELALVQAVSRGGEVVLDRILQNDYEPYLAVVRVLARRPVNLNTAPVPVLEALFANLQVVGRNARVTRDEAQKIAELVVESRPFEGFEDFLRRAVLPAAGIAKLPGDAPVVPAILGSLTSGTGIIDPDDAMAVYANGLDANDGTLQYSTMPYAFTTRDTYAVELRATVDAPSGIERFSLVRDSTELVVPQRELLALWARQEDFDEAIRLDQEAPWWMTGPSATSRWDGGSVPPSRLWAHLGTAEGQPYLPGVTDPEAFKDRESPPTSEHVFASREEAGWIQLWPSRVSGKPNEQGRVIHFDHETRDPEGRYLPDQVVSRTTDDTQVAWTPPNGLLMRPAYFSMWVKPKAIGDSTLLDVGGTSRDADRMSLVIEGPDLVLRVISAGGDHRIADAFTDPFEEYGEARFAIARGPGPGLPVDGWSHVELDVRGNRPDQVHMLVNGLAHGVRTPGLTRLTTQVGQNDSMIPVESVEGFPPRCTVRIGNELAEVEVAGNALRALRYEEGANAGFGGRIARGKYASQRTDAVDFPAEMAFIDTSHQSGTPVQLYGYSTPLVSSVPGGQGRLTSELGPFRVAVVETVARADGSPFVGDPILIGPWSYTAGYGMEGANSQVGALVLRCADDPAAQPEQYMPAFSPMGGYAAIVQVVGYSDPARNKTTVGTTIGGIEVVRYSGWSGNTLTLAARGDGFQLPDLQGLEAGQSALVGGRRAFVTTFAGQFEPDNREMEWRCYTIPISIPVTGGSAIQMAPPATKAQSSVLQITHVQDAENTEWVRYDWFSASDSQFVRDDPAALIGVYHQIVIPHPFDPPDQGGGPGGTGEGAGSPPAEEASSAPWTASSAPRAPQTNSSQWLPDLGVDANQSQGNAYPFSASISDRLQFRGVMGTHSHAHAGDTLLLPVFNVGQTGLDGGRPGRLDAAFLFAADYQHLGWPVRVHRAHAPSDVLGVRRWAQQGNALVAMSTGEDEITPTSSTSPTEIYLHDTVFVALQTASPEPILPGSASTQPPGVVDDARGRSRLACFPSGERPRIVGRVTIGGGFDGAQSGAVPSAVVDEIVFGEAQPGRSTGGATAEVLAGGSSVLSAELLEQDLQISVIPNILRLADGRFDGSLQLPQDAGLLRIGEEIVCYNRHDPQNGRIDLTPGGRGLLGTRAQHHEVTEPVTFLEHRPVTFIAGPIGAGDAALVVADTTDFPPQGTVLVGAELLHYTRLRGGALEMPRASSVPGRMDGKGDGLFRGRYGTTAAAHGPGEPVILFPFRYWDRWQPKADAPELAYFGLTLDQPSAFLGSCFFFKEDAEMSRIGVLQRSDPDAPWDADPESDSRLKLHAQGDLEGAPIPIGVQTDRVDWRVFVQYDPGAFDLATGLPHGWKQTPRLTRFGAFYFGPGIVLSSVER